MRFPEKPPPVQTPPGFGARCVLTCWGLGRRMLTQDGLPPKRVGREPHLSPSHPHPAPSPLILPFFPVFARKTSPKTLQL